MSLEVTGSDIWTGLNQQSKERLSPSRTYLVSRVSFVGTVKPDTETERAVKGRTLVKSIAVVLLVKA